MRRVLIVTALALALLPATAHAAFPGASGKIAFVQSNKIWTVNPDGSDPTQITAGTDAGPAWSPDGTKIAFHRVRPGCTPTPCDDIYVANPDGSNVTLAITAAQFPAWSPTGQEMVFMAGAPKSTAEYGHIWKSNVDGTNRTLLYNWEDADIYGIGGPAWVPDATATIAFHEGTLASACNPDLEECANLYPEALYTTPATMYTQLPGGPGTPGAGPNWSPDARKFAFYTPLQHPEFPVGDLGGRIGTVNRDGSGRVLLTPGAGGYVETPGFDKQPAWSPDGSRIAFERNADGLHVINADGTGDTRISTVGRDPDWQPVQRSHVRPKSAIRFRVPLVPAYMPCTASNRTHGPPLAFPSCNPPQREGPNLTLGVGDGNPALGRSEGYLKLVVVGTPGPPEDSDASIRFQLTNVMHASDLSEYTGELRSEVTVRRTDREGPTSASHSTTTDFSFGFTVPCSPTPSSSLDASSCVSFTSIDAVVPGALPDGHRTIWELDKVRVYDGGPDEDADSEEDNSLLATQGVFVP
jgi:Tol biopolymer transport system component